MTSTKIARQLISSCVDSAQLDDLLEAFPKVDYSTLKVLPSEAKIEKTLSAKRVNPACAIARIAKSPALLDRLAADTRITVRKALMSNPVVSKSEAIEIAQKGIDEGEASFFTELLKRLKSSEVEDLALNFDGLKGNSASMDAAREALLEHPKALFKIFSPDIKSVSFLGECRTLLKAGFSIDEVFSSAKALKLFVEESNYFSRNNLQEILESKKKSFREVPFQSARLLRFMALRSLTSKDGLEDLKKLNSFHGSELIAEAMTYQDSYIPFELTLAEIESVIGSDAIDEYLEDAASARFEDPESIRRVLASPLGYYYGSHDPSGLVSYLRERNELVSFLQDSTHPKYSDSKRFLNAMRSGHLEKEELETLLETGTIFTTFSDASLMMVDRDLLKRVIRAEFENSRLSNLLIGNELLPVVIEVLTETPGDFVERNINNSQSRPLNSVLSSISTFFIDTFDESAEVDFSLVNVIVRYGSLNQLNNLLCIAKDKLHAHADFILEAINQRDEKLRSHLVPFLIDEMRANANELMLKLVSEVDYNHSGFASFSRSRQETVLDIIRGLATSFDAKSWQTLIPLLSTWQGSTTDLVRAVRALN